MKRLTRTGLIFAAYDLVLVICCTLFVVWVHDDFTLGKRDFAYHIAFFLFPLLWLVLSSLTRKFRLGEKSNQKQVFLSVLFSNLIITATVSTIMVLTGLTFFSRFILFGTIGFITVFEWITGSVYVSIQNSVFLKDWIGMDIPPHQVRDLLKKNADNSFWLPRDLDQLHASMQEEAGPEASAWIGNQLEIDNPRTLVISTGTRFNIINFPSGFFTAIVNLQRINALRRINKFFETVSSKLPEGGIFIGCVETYHLRKHRILTLFPWGINYMVYSFDFLFHRVFPKLALTRKLYFIITRGERRVLSRTESIGRIYSCGFEVIEEQTIGDLLYWKAQKVRDPYFDPNPTYGMFIRLRRIGQHGEEFNVFKMRTMHAYAEYIQQYVYEQHHLGDGGKFKDDFRVSTMGRFIRKMWLDELPMLLNVLKGDMKIVGVRPLSKHYFSLYSEEIRKMRVRTKPGLIPPFYAQFPTPVSIEDVQENERIYLEAYEKHPFATDLRYFFLAMKNILFKRARSN